MGCNESKHDAVATGNTTAAHRRKPNFHMKAHKDLEPILEADGEASNKDSDTEVVVVASAAAAAAAVGAGAGAGAAAADVKDINVNTEMNKKEEKEGMVEESRELLVGGDSPDWYFSSRKDEDAIKAIVEGAEETGSGYCTPRHESEPEKDDFYDDADDADNNGKQKLMTKIEEKLGSTIENGKERSSDTPTK